MKHLSKVLTNEHMEYRKDIQILRGIAVLLVVGFHFGLAGFNSGFLGVDVFFVISGYLMAVMYNPKKKGEFFVSRARRLLRIGFINCCGLAIPQQQVKEQNSALPLLTRLISRND